MEEQDDTRTIADGPPAFDGDDGGLIGTDVGGYVIESELGRGGMGVVYAATHPVIGKRAAIKVLRRSLSNNPATAERFVQEARSVNQIGHPNIVDIFAFGVLPDGRSYLVMDLLEGETLRRRVKRGAVPVHDALHIIDEIASALAAAHNKGFIHRDLKPDNVFLVEHAARTDVKLLDFGLAKLAPNATTTTARAFRTATGAQIGTPDYMSPEQLRDGADVDHRTDIYALGVLAFEILARERPRRYGDGTFELGGLTMGQVLGRASIPAQLIELVESMVAPARDHRPSLTAIRAVLKRVRPSLPAVDVPPGPPSVPPVSTPPASSMPAASSQPPMYAGLAAPRAASLHASTKLGVAPAQARTGGPHPVHAQTPPTDAGRRLWLIMGLVLAVTSAVALAFVLAT